MNYHPIIGLPTQTVEAVAGELPKCWIMSQQYIKTLASMEGVPFLIPLLGDKNILRAIYETLDGIFLCGGVDVAPKNYGQQKQSHCGRVDEERDDTELQLLEWAKKDKKPVFGVCRGAQVINVAYGGTLYQDIAFEIRGAIKHDCFPSHGPYARNSLIHPVSIDIESRLGRTLGARSLKVNSMHHQAIAELGSGLIPTAWAPDGVVEGLESQNGHYLVGVQWHPEELVPSDPRMCQLFKRFMSECFSFRKQKQRNDYVTTAY